jgi:hypothetical protein
MAGGSTTHSLIFRVNVPRELLVDKSGILLLKFMLSRRKILSMRDSEVSHRDRTYLRSDFLYREIHDYYDYRSASIS